MELCKRASKNIVAMFTIYVTHMRDTSSTNLLTKSGRDLTLRLLEYAHQKSQTI